MFEFLKRIFKGKRPDSSPAAQPDPVAVYALTSDTSGNNAGKSGKNVADAGASTEGLGNNIANASAPDDSFDGDTDSIEDGDFDFDS